MVVNGDISLQHSGSKGMRKMSYEIITDLSLLRSALDFVFIVSYYAL